MAKKLAPNEALQKISDWLAEAYGRQLLSLVVYGSAAGGHRHTQRSDVNLLAVLDHVDAAALDAGAAAIRWWAEQGNPPVVMLAKSELEDAATVFPIEWLDIQANHSVLRGEDFFQQVSHSAELHRNQLQHELRAQLLRLRGAYMRHGHEAKRLEALLLDSVSTFLTLFRHALVVVGQPIVWPKDGVLRSAAAAFAFSPASWQAILEARHENRRLEGGNLDKLRQLFAQYLSSIQTVEQALENFHAPSPA